MMTRSGLFITMVAAAALPACGDPAADAPAETAQAATLPCGGFGVDGKLKRGDVVKSCSGVFMLAHQSDGNVVLYNKNYDTWIWQTHTAGKSTTELVLQSDGNLVLYGPSGAHWATHTTQASSLALQNDGNMVLYGPPGVRWATWTDQGGDNETCGHMGACNGRKDDAVFNSCFANTNVGWGGEILLKNGADWMGTLQLNGAGNCRGYVHAQIKPWNGKGVRPVEVWIERSDGARFGQSSGNADFFNELNTTMWDLRGQQLRACGVIHGAGGVSGCTGWNVATFPP